MTTLSQVQLIVLPRLVNCNKFSLQSQKVDWGSGEFHLLLRGHLHQPVCLCGLLKVRSQEYKDDSQAHDGPHFFWLLVSGQLDLKVRLFLLPDWAYVLSWCSSVVLDCTFFFLCWPRSELFFLIMVNTYPWMLNEHLRCWATSNMSDISIWQPCITKIWQPCLD